MRKCPRNTVFSLLFNNVRRNDMQVAQEALRSYRGVFLFRGIIAILFGIVAFVWPGITAFVFLFLIAAWAIVTGVMQVVAALTLPLATGREWLLGLAGLASIIFGILIALWPRIGLLTVVWLIGIYAIVFGILYIVRYFQTRSLASSPT